MIARKFRERMSTSEPKLRAPATMPSGTKRRRMLMGLLIG